MRTDFEHYIQNIYESIRISKQTLDSSHSDEEILKQIQKNTLSLQNIRHQQDVVLQSIFSMPVSQMTDSLASELFEFASLLMDFSKQIDLGTAYTIHKRLLEYATLHHQVDLIIRENYFCGLSLYYLNTPARSFSISLYQEQIFQYFQAAVSWLDHYDEIPNSETRGYIMRAVGNLRLAFSQFFGSYEQPDECYWENVESYRKQFQFALSILSDPYYQRQNPELPWDSYLYALYYGRFTLLACERVEPRKEIEQELLESANYVYEHKIEAEKQKNKSLSGRLTYVYNTSRYHAGLISSEELLENLFQSTETTSLSDFSSDGVFKNLSLVNYIEYYYMNSSKRIRMQFSSRMVSTRNRANQYLNHYNKTEFHALALEYVRNYMTLMDTRNSPTYRKMATYILDCFLACHHPTYIHSLMVAELSELIAAQLAKCAPQYLIGLEDTRNEAEVAEKLPELLHFIYQCGLYHDIGKGAILSIVDIYHRKLYPEEFEIIKCHPEIGYLISSSLHEREGFMQPILRHHIWADEIHGYPKNPRKPKDYSPVAVDIVSIADSIDAATDNVGRSYASSKSFDVIVEELRAQSGTRYASYLVKLFDDTDFYQKLCHVLQETRKRNYIRVYRGNDTKLQ